MSSWNDPRPVHGDCEECGLNIKVPHGSPMLCIRHLPPNPPYGERVTVQRDAPAHRAPREAMPRTASDGLPGETL